jgi:hypothetical protein
VFYGDASASVTAAEGPEDLADEEGIDDWNLDELQYYAMPIAKCQVPKQDLIFEWSQNAIVFHF